MTATITSAAPCVQCGAELAAGDRFCAGCGGRVPEQRAVSAARDTPVEALVAAAAAAHPGARLDFDTPFCRACGADHERAAATCPDCGRPVGAPAPVAPAPLATVHVFRRKLLKRPAIRISATQLLFESGELMEIAELPEPAPPPVAGEPLRTTQGELVRIADAIAAGAVKAKWAPDALIDAAIAATPDEATARALALDLLALGRPELIDRLDALTASERAWARAVRAAHGGDHAAVIAAVAELPPAGYRPKLALILGAWRGADASVLEPQLGDDDPYARLLARALGFAEPAPSETRELLERTPLPEPLARDFGAVAASLHDESPAVPAGTHLNRDARALIAHDTGAPGLVHAPDVDGLPLAIVDDLLDTGALSESAALAGATGSRGRYLCARLTPERLSDADVAALEHDAERIRRAFRRGDTEALAAELELPAGRHYATLDALRRNKPKQAVADHVFARDLPVVEALFALMDAGDRDLSELLSDRVLADPTVWPVVVEIAGSTGLPATGALRERFPAFAEWLSLTQARDFLYLGEWDGAVAAADHCLALAELEDVRDEALNLKACALYYLGRDAQAVATLEQALEGDYSEGLLANIGIAATNLAPEVAARHLGTLIDEAPTTAMRAGAAHRALTIWAVNDTSSWSNSDNSPLPDAFQDALRRLIAVEDLALDDFRAFAGVLAVQDAAWFADARNLGRSPHRNTLEGRFFVARASDLHAMIDVMGGAIAAGSPPPWLLHERDTLREAALEILFNNLDEPDSTFGAIALRDGRQGRAGEPVRPPAVHAAGDRQHHVPPVRARGGGRRPDRLAGARRARALEAPGAR